MYRTYEPEKFIHIKNWLEKDKVARNVFKTIDIPDLYDVSCSKFDADFCPKYYEWYPYDKKFAIFGFSKEDMKKIKSALDREDVDYMVTDNKARRTSSQEIVDKIRYLNYVENRKKGKLAS